MKKYSRAEAWIHLDNIEKNVEILRQQLKKETKMFAVVKTDGYGHGAAEIARLLEPKEYVFGFAVATVEEGIGLRKAGIKKPVLLLGYVFEEQFPELLDWELTPALFTFQSAEALSKEAVRRGKKVKAHMKVDTGMGRIGLQTGIEGQKEAERMFTLPNLEWEGIFTHMARADERDKTSARVQIQEFLGFVEALEEKGLHFSYRHCANSAGIMEIKEADLELVRAGIAMYGIEPSPEVGRKRVPLVPALELKSRLVHVKRLEAGRSISYGGIYVLPKAQFIGTVPIGYGDGYPRSLSNKGYVLVHGKKAPIRGRICMDQMMVDVTGIEGVHTGTEVTLIGKDQGAEITVEELGALSGRFPYEFVCDLGKRIPRVFCYGDEVIGSRDDF